MNLCQADLIRSIWTHDPLASVIEGKLQGCKAKNGFPSGDWKDIEDVKTHYVSFRGEGKVCFNFELPISLNQEDEPWR